MPFSWAYLAHLQARSSTSTPSSFSQSACHWNVCETLRDRSSGRTVVVAGNGGMLHVVLASMKYCRKMSRRFVSHFICIWRERCLSCFILNNDWLSKGWTTRLLIAIQWIADKYPRNSTEFIPWWWISALSKTFTSVSKTRSIDSRRTCFLLFFGDFSMFVTAVCVLFMFSYTFRKHRNEKKENNVDSLCSRHHYINSSCFFCLHGVCFTITAEIIALSLANFYCL